MTIVPAPLVTAPAGRGIRYGLFAAATGPLELPIPHGFGGGVRYEPVTCGFARRYPLECDDSPPAKVFDPAEPWITAEPFLVYSSLVCGAAGHTSAELEIKVRQRLTNGEQKQAEAGLADVLAAEAVPAGGGYDPGNIRGVVADLEHWLYDTAGYGNVGYIHAPVRVAAYASANGLLQRDGGLWHTNLGTVVVFGAGYPDDGVIYISGQTTVWRAADVFVPTPDQTFSKTTNQYYLLAEREYAVAFDCVAAFATFTPDLPAS